MAEGCNHTLFHDCLDSMTAGSWEPKQLQGNIPEEVRTMGQAGGS